MSFLSLRGQVHLCLRRWVAAGPPTKIPGRGTGCRGRRFRRTTRFSKIVGSRTSPQSRHRHPINGSRAIVLLGSSSVMAAIRPRHLGQVICQPPQGKGTKFYARDGAMPQFGNLYGLKVYVGGLAHGRGSEPGVSSFTREGTMSEEEEKEIYSSRGAAEGVSPTTSFRYR